MMLFIKNILWVYLAVSSTPLSIHPSVSTYVHCFAHLFYSWSMHAFHLAANEKAMGRWRKRGSERDPSVWRDEQMWERDRKRKSQIIAAFNEVLEL